MEILPEPSEWPAIMAARGRILETAQGGTLTQVLRATLDELEGLTGSCIGFFHFLETDQKTLTLQAWSTRTEREFCHAVGHGAHYGLDEAGVWADAVRTGRPVLHNDYASLPLRKGMPEGHAEVVREMVVPILRGRRITAILGLGNKPTPYGDRDLRVVCTLADLAWDIAQTKRMLAERQAIEDALREQEFFFRESQRAAAIGSYKTDFRLGRWQSSAVLDQLFGISEAYERTVANWLAIVHPEDREMMAAYLTTDVIGRRQPFAKEYRILRGDGETRWVNGLGEVTFDAGGAPLSLTGTIQDITERRLRDQELQRKNEEMERFTFMVSHDLKGPLVTVRTFLGYLEQDLEEGRAERVARDLGFIRDAAGRMGRLLEDLLEVSRVGRVVNPPVQVSYLDLAQAAVASLAGAIALRGAEVRVEAAEVLLTGDRPRLEELWQNLLENAVKYLGDQAAPVIELGVEQAAGKVFYVRDNGIGIDPRFQGRIFGLFDQLDPASEGTGLGLALVRRIVELYDGRIWVESEGPGRGTCFKFTLPAALKHPQRGAPS